MATLHLNKGCSEFIEDSCIICKSACMKKILGTDGQISSKDLFSLLDTPNKGIDKAYYLSTCYTCSKKIGRLQGIYDTLTEIQKAFKQLQVEVASKIVSNNCFPELQEEEEEEDDDVRVIPPDDNVHSSVAVQDTLYTICKRWRRELNEIQIGSDGNETTIRSLMGITTKIPEGLIIRPSPAPPPQTGTLLSQTISQNQYQVQYENHQQQQQVEVVHQEGIEIISPNRNINNNNDNSNNTNDNAPLPPPVQFHLDLNDFDEILDEGVEEDDEEEDDVDDDTQAPEYPINNNNNNDNCNQYNNSGKVIDYVNLQDEDSSSNYDDDDDDRGEVNTEDLIPTVELSTSSSSDHNTYLVQQDVVNLDSLGAQVIQPNSSVSITRSLSIETQINPDIQLSPARSPYVEPNDDDGFDDTMLSTGMLPVGQAAVSPGCEPRSSKTRKTRNTTSNQIKLKTLHPTRTQSSNSKSQIFRCTQCPKSFKNREEFKEHLNNHKNLAPTCPICQKVFPRRHNLIIHMRIHSGETPYCCPVCSQRYSDRSNYNAHVRKHLDRPFGCLICRKMFKTSHEAQSHAQTMHPNNSDKNIISKVTYKRKPTQ